ncbi:MAG TPA: ribonuclease P protein component [Aromatoleum sp.]|uniref:ribonuclease P protein component n=1 Tax=Aromatoleum sp. TaxID=2307007 RepID=UPI002B48A296|nr:ribonuclease P protein component [Aromatoleum sp.]HJV28365.1 ribonuclease P protein component [Aromatoleum sp.]
MSSPSGVDERFLSAYKLCKTDEFSSVFAFRRALKGRFFMIHYRPNELPTARLGVVVAKKLAKHANLRNLLKRIVREHFRKIRASLPPQDLIVRLHAPVRGVTRAAINEDVAQLFGRVQRS